MQLKLAVPQAPEAFGKYCVLPPFCNSQSCAVQPAVLPDPVSVYPFVGWPGYAPPLILGLVIAPAARQPAALVTRSKPAASQVPELRMWAEWIVAETDKLIP